MLVKSDVQKLTFRSSMRKFSITKHHDQYKLTKIDIPNPTIEQRTLEVLNFTAPGKRACLNRQLILLLSALGVPDDYFLGLVDKQLVIQGDE